MRDGRAPATKGELNYALTAVAMDWLDMHNVHLTYDRLADVISAFECAKLEFYRRMVVPYEERKCDQNGDVYL